tara:strand:- start:1303 stop:1563 length:261 start_codon:yes stop_codon:yes gene_type:complete
MCIVVSLSRKKREGKHNITEFFPVTDRLLLLAEDFVDAFGVRPVALDVFVFFSACVFDAFPVVGVLAPLLACLGFLAVFDFLVPSF